MEEEAKGERSHEEEGQGRQRVPWRPRALLGTLFAAVVIVACVDDSPLGPRARTGSAESMVGKSIDPASCRYKRADWQRNFYGKSDGLNGDTTTVCGVLVSVSAPPTFGDTGVAWYLGVDPDSIYISSGSWLGPYQGQIQTYIKFNKIVKDVQILWGFSPMSGSTITLYDANDSVLAVHTNGAGSQPSRFPSNYPNFGDFHWEELATFTVTGVRKIKLETAGSPPGGASTRAQLFFKPDCPPILNDSLINQPMVREIMFNALEASLGDALRIERGGAMYMDSTAVAFGIFAQPYPQTAGGITATDCSFPMQIQNQAGYTVLATYHSHGRTPNDAPTFTNCAQYPSGSTAAYGPSQQDFNVANTTGKTVYALDKDYLYRIQPNMANQTPGTYEQRWDVDRNARCFQ